MLKNLILISKPRNIVIDEEVEKNIAAVSLLRNSDDEKLFSGSVSEKGNLPNNGKIFFRIDRIS